MAIFQSPVLGKLKKSIGNTVTYVNNGQNIIRAKPVSINDAQSNAQVEIRDNLKNGVTLFQKLSPIINLGMVKGTQTTSPYNRFISAYQNAMKPDGNGVKKTDYKDIILSNGNLDTLIDFTIPILPIGKTVDFNWSNSNVADPKLLAVQKMAIVIIYNDEIIAISYNAIKRSDAQATINMSNTIGSPTGLHVYAFAYIEGVNSTQTVVI